MNGALILVARRATRPGLVVTTELPGELKTFRAYGPATGERLVAAMLDVLDRFSQEEEGE